MQRASTAWPDERDGHGRSVALAVGVGGTGSAAAVGVFRALQRAGIRVEAITGSSSGGVVAAALALGWAPETIEAVLRRLWLPAVARGSRHRAGLRLALPGRSGAEAGAFALTDGETLDERVRRAFGNATFADAGVRLRIVTTDVVSGDSVVLESGPVAAAVRASLTVPLLVPPVPYQGRMLVDGALSDPLPVLEAAADGAGAVIALAFPCRSPARAGPVVGAVLGAHAAATNNLLRLASAYQDLAAPGRVLRLECELGGPAALFDASGVGAAIAEGERAMEAQLEELTRLLV